MECSDITKQLVNSLRKKYFYHAKPDWQGFFDEIPPKDIPTVAQDIYRKKDVEVMNFLQYMDRLPSKMFINFQGVEEIVLPNNIIQIGGQLFKNCKNLRKVTIQGDIDEIPYQCFSGCSSLTEVSLPSTISKIGKGAFEDCPDNIVIYKEKSGKRIQVQGSQEEIDFIQSHLQTTGGAP